jgi:maltose alpha-D-glucosyltransferase/alpha-amylase
MRRRLDRAASARPNGGGTRVTRATPWYRHAVFYEVRVRSFRDGNGDGAGDLPGLTSRLDYLAELGVDALWLMPMFPSPGVDDGYDVADYCAVDPAAGTLEDFDAMLAAAHARGIRVILDLVLNHTSDEHPWFVESRSSRASAKRDWYVWSDDDTRYAGVRLMFSGIETSNWAWDEGSGQFYWHRFFRRQPDLNFDHPPVREAIWEVLRFWLERGVDGFRVDAVPYLVEREGTSCEGLPETHAVIRELRRRMDERFPGRVLLAEACQSPEELLPYFGAGDEFHMAFHFPLVPKLFLALLRENREPIERALAHTPAVPADCQWGLFLRNHDEMSLALETAAERDELLDSLAAQPGRAHLLAPPPAG